MTAPRDTLARPARTRVSVVVPVYEPGAGFDDLVASLDRQTLSAADFEVLLCDDGSGEQTRERLRHVAETRPHFRVLTLPRAGGPGTPRNHGIAAASGEYVQFVDQDDHLFDAALEHLCDYADAQGSDVVIGKEVGIGRRIPRRIFERDIPRAVLGEDPILDMLTPHKLFRTAFLREHDIRFPDGRVRLEDHLFVMRAYFEAATISVLASEPCYAWVNTAGSLSSSRLDPPTYFRDLEKVLDLVDAYTEPGDFRDRLHRHWLRGKILRRIAGRRMLRYPAEYRDRFLDVVGPLTVRRFGPGVDRGLALPDKVRAALLRADRRDDLAHLAAFEADLQCRVEVVSARWSRGGGLHLSVRAPVTREGAPAPVFDRDSAQPGQVRWAAPPELADLPPETLDARRDVRADRVSLYLDEPDGHQRTLASRRGSGDRTIRLTVDPLRVFGRGDPSGGGRITAAVRRGGWTFDTDLRADPAVLAAAGRSPLLAGPTCVLVAGEDGSVELRREWPTGRMKDLAGRAARRVRSTVRRVARQITKR